MTKYKNPFYTIWEAIAIFDSRGASTLRNLPENQDSDQAQIDWREHILSVIVSRNYEGAEHHFVMDIHLDREGFEELHMLVGGTAEFKDHSSEYNEVFFEISPLLRVCALIPKLKEETIS